MEKVILPTLMKKQNPSHRDFPYKKQWWQLSISHNSISQVPNLFSPRKKANAYELITHALNNPNTLYKTVVAAEMAFYLAFDVLANGFI